MVHYNVIYLQDVSSSLSRNTGNQFYGRYVTLRQNLSWNRYISQFYPLMIFNNLFLSKNSQNDYLDIPILTKAIKGAGKKIECDFRKDSTLM